MNPLLFPEVLRVLFDYTEVATLYNCRLVCHVWNEEANGKLQNRLQISFSNLAQVGDYNQLCQDNDSSDTSHQKLHPLTIYKLSGFNSPWQDTMQLFFKNSTSLITSLELKVLGWTLWDYQTFFSETEFPNLAHFSFECPSQHNQQQEALLTICYHQKIPEPKLTSLKTLEICELTHRFNPWVCKLIELNKHLIGFSLKENRIIRSIPSSILESLLINNTFEKLQYLHLDYYFTNTQMTQIVQHFPPQLKTLSFALLSSVKPRLMYLFLKSTSNTLRKLHLEYEYTWEKMSLDQFQFPPLENLTHLSIKFLRGSLNSLMMNVQSTNLRCLSLCGFESVGEYGNYSEFSTSLEQLSIVSSPNCSFYIDEICGLFPSIKYLKLQGQLTNEIMHSIITKLKSLEGMYLAPQRSYFSDEGLIGNPAGEVSQELESVESSSPCSGIPCICQLKELTALHLDVNPRLSDSIIQGLGHCTNLKYLTLKSPKLTETLLLTLAERLSLESLTFHGGQINPKAIAEVEEKIPDCHVQEIASFDIRIVLHSQNNVITCRVV